MQNAIKLLEMIENFKDKLNSEEYLTVVNLIHDISKTDLYKVSIIYADASEFISDSNNFESETNVRLYTTSFISKFKSNVDKKDYLLESVLIFDLEDIFEDVPEGLIKDTHDLLGTAEVEIEDSIMTSKQIYKKFNFVNCIITTTKLE